MKKLTIKVPEFVNQFDDASHKASGLAAHRLEAHYFEGIKVVAKKGAKFFEPVDIRFYAAGKYPAKIHCCVWISGTFKGEQVYTYGGGGAGGYGYDRKSAAMSAALERAGVDLGWSLGGTGESERAASELAKALGFKTFTVVRCHG